MSDFLNKLKSVFVVEEGATTAQTPSAQPEATQTAPNNSQPTTTTSNSRTSGGAVNDKFVDILFGALEKNNQDGFDYFEFKQSLRSLAKMPMDEATRFQSAYAMAQTMGASPAKLVESAKFYLNILNGEQAKFNEAHAQQRAKLIGNREEEIQNLEVMVQQKTEQIKQLTQQIEEHRQKSEQIRLEISDNTVKIETTKDDFEATFSVVAGQIQEDVSKIQQYLK